MPHRLKFRGSPAGSPRARLLPAAASPCSRLPVRSPLPACSPFLPSSTVFLFLILSIFSPIAFHSLMTCLSYFLLLFPYLPLSLPFPASPFIVALFFLFAYLLGTLLAPLLCHFFLYMEFLVQEALGVQKG